MGGEIYRLRREVARIVTNESKGNRRGDRYYTETVGIEIDKSTSTKFSHPEDGDSTFFRNFGRGIIVVGVIIE